MYIRERYLKGQYNIAFHDFDKQNDSIYGTGASYKMDILRISENITTPGSLTIQFLSVQKCGDEWYLKLWLFSKRLWQLSGATLI